MNFLLSEYLPTLLTMQAIHLIPTSIKIICILIATYIIKRIFSNFLLTLFAKSQLDPMIKELLLNAATWFLYTASMLLILENIGIHATLLVNTFGITGLTIGFAAQDIVSNIAAGILILIYQPFSKGDYIKIKDFEGFILSINIRHTKLEKDGFTVIIPNNILYSGVVAIKKTN